MGPYGSVWAHIKTGRSPMAHDHFQTPLDPKRGYKTLKNTSKICFFSPGKDTTKSPKLCTWGLNAIGKVALWQAAGNNASAGTGSGLEIWGPGNPEI